jgi:hypothetical protein
MNDNGAARPFNRRQQTARDLSNFVSMENAGITFGQPGSMRIAVAVLLLVHGLLHLMGLLKPWKLDSGDFDYYQWEIVDVEVNRTTLWGED